MEAAGPPIEANIPVVPLSGDIGLTVYRRFEDVDDGQLSWVPIQFFCSDDFIVALRDTVLKAIRESERAAEREIDEAERAFNRVLRKAYTVWRKSPRAMAKGAPTNFTEWVDENESDYSDQKADCIANVPYKAFGYVLSRTTARRTRKAASSVG